MQASRSRHASSGVAPSKSLRGDQREPGQAAARRRDTGVVGLIRIERILVEAAERDRRVPG
jgi:hypothetical protein